MTMGPFGAILRLFRTFAGAGGGFELFNINYSNTILWNM